jgi:hypothetical protein
MEIKRFTGLLLIFSFFAPVLSLAENICAVPRHKISFEEHSSAPTDVVVEADGSIGIYDAFSGSYLTYDSNGKATGSTQKTYLKGGNCLVRGRNFFIFCNNANASLDILSESLESRRSFRLPPDMKGRYDPSDALISEDFVYSVDNDNHRVIKSNLSGEYSQSVGNYGQSGLAFWYPYAIAADAKGVLYISEVMNTRVQKITTELKFYEFIGKWGIKSGEFYRPSGIAIYKGATLLVADGYTGVIQSLDMDGKYTGLLADGTGKKIQLGSPTHIRVNGNVMAVVDAFNKAVHVYQLIAR